RARPAARSARYRAGRGAALRRGRRPCGGRGAPRRRVAPGTARDGRRRRACRAGRRRHRAARARAEGRPLVRRVSALLALALLLAGGVVEARPWSWLGVRIRDLAEQEMEELAAKHGIREGFGV